MTTLHFVLRQLKLLRAQKRRAAAQPGVHDPLAERSQSTRGSPAASTPSSRSRRSP